MFKKLLSTEIKIFTGIGLLTVIVVIGAAMVFGATTPPPKKQILGVKDQQQYLVHKDSHKIAAPKSQITLVEFADFECPGCGIVYPTIKKLLKEYNGKITYVFRQYPLQMHQNGAIAAEVAEAAGAQGKFFEMEDKLFLNQKEWGESKSPMNYFTKYASELKLNVTTFKADVQAKKYKERIQHDLNDGNAVGLEATPTFFLNGEKIEGGLEYKEFKAKIDAILKASK
jgi:protein-disulfide isomerase